MFNKETCLLVEQEDVSFRSTRRHVVLFSKRQEDIFVVEQQNMSSCSTSQLVQREDMSSFLTRRHFVVAMALEGVVEDLGSTTLDGKFESHLQLRRGGGKNGYGLQLEFVHDSSISDPSSDADLHSARRQSS